MRKQIDKASHSETFQKFGTNFIQNFGTNYSKFGRNYSGIWEKLFRNLGEIQRFRNSEITQKLFRNYSEIISENMRRKNLFRSEFFWNKLGLNYVSEQIDWKPKSKYSIQN